MLGRTTDDLVRRFGWLRGIRLALQFRLLKLLPRDTLVRCDVPLLAHPVYLRARTSDLAVLREMLRDDVAAIPLVPARFVIDAGANIGLVSALLATRFPGARIAALEIDQANFALLRRNVGPYGNVTPMHRGLWSHATELSIANPGDAEWAFRAREGGDAVTRVRAVSVDDLLREFGETRVDILKVDIEGAETEVFGEESERWLARVTQIVIELHERFVPGCEQLVVQRLGSRFTRQTAGGLDLFLRVP